MVGAPGRIRTCDSWYRKPVLYPLSYGGIAPRLTAGLRVTLQPNRDGDESAPGGAELSTGPASVRVAQRPADTLGR